MNLEYIKEHLKSWPYGVPEHPDAEFDTYLALGWLVWEVEALKRMLDAAHKDADKARLGE